MAEPQWRIKEWFPKLDPRALERLRIYHLELIRWTQKINLISPLTVETADRIHFSDSILAAQMILKDLNPAEKEIWDFGSGNGMPGAIIGILRPTLGVLCIDSDERKIAFIQQLAMRLELDNIAARAVRVESIKADSVKCAVARGFAPLERALVLTQSVFASQGIFYHLKAAEWEREYKSVSKAISSTWNSQVVGHYNLPTGKEMVAGGKTEQHTILKSVHI